MDCKFYVLYDQKASHGQILVYALWITASLTYDTSGQNNSILSSTENNFWLTSFFSMKVSLVKLLIPITLIW